MKYLLPALLMLSLPLAAQDTTTTDSIYITPLSVELSTATVRARPIRDGELATQRIGQLAIYLNPAAKADPLLAVNTLPAATNPDETANVSFRGSPSAATGIYLNDVPIRSAVRLDQSNGVGQFSLFGQVPLREVQTYASAPPVHFSQTSAGAVGLYTSAELPSQRESSLSLNLTGIGASHARLLGEKTGLRAYANYTNLSAFRLANQEGLPELRRSRAGDAAVQLVHRFSERTRLQVFYLGFQEAYRFGVRTPYYSGDFEQRKPRHLAVVNWRLAGEDWNWRLNQSLDWERPTFRFGNVVTKPRRVTGHLAAHGSLRRAGQTLRVGGALNSYHDRTRGTYPTTEFGLAPESPSAAYDTATVNNLLEVYAYNQVRFGERWLLGGGVKPIFLAGEDELRYTAQVSVRYRAGTAHRLTLGGGRFNQYLAPGPDFNYWQWLTLRQVALEYTYNKDALTVDAAVYAKREDYGRTADLDVRGGECRVQFQDIDWLVWASGAVVRSRTVGAAVPTDRDLPFLARAQIQRQFGGQWTVGLAGSWRSGRYFRPVIDREQVGENPEWFAPVLAEEDAGERYPKYRRVDLSASKIIDLGKRQLIVYCNVNNVLNAENVRAYAYDGRYTERREELYSRRVIFVGGMVRW